MATNVLVTTQLRATIIGVGGLVGREDFEVLMTVS